MMKKLLLLVGYGLLHTGVVGAQALTIDSCYHMARAHYPLIKKIDLMARASRYDLKNENKRFLPQLNFSGQATYQSQVVDYGDLLGDAALPAGFSPPALSKDQYRIQGEISQLIYDGGNTKSEKDLIGAKAAVQTQNVAANLYAIKSRINGLFFSILLMDAQLRQNKLHKTNLQTQIEKTKAALQNGVAFRSSLDELKAEMVNIEMTGTEYTANRVAYLKMLSLFIGRALPNSTQLAVPETKQQVITSIDRPELKTFALQQSVYKLQVKQLKSGYLPEVSLFFQGAYGRPTLNILQNEFGAWYITGVRFNWSLGRLYSLSNRKHSLLIHQQEVAADRETFLLNTKIDLTGQQEDIKKYQALIAQDETAIALRSSVTKAAEAQLNNGVITTHEYIQKVNAEYLSRQKKVLHEIQLLQAQYNRKFISGN